MQHQRAGCGVARGQKLTSGRRPIGSWASVWSDRAGVFLEEAGSTTIASTLVLLLILLNGFLTNLSPVHAELALNTMLIAVLLGQGFGQEPFPGFYPKPWITKSRTC